MKKQRVAIWLLLFGTIGVYCQSQEFTKNNGKQSKISHEFSPAQADFDPESISQTADMALQTTNQRRKTKEMVKSRPARYVPEPNTNVAPSQMHMNLARQRARLQRERLQLERENERRQREQEQQARERALRERAQQEQRRREASARLLQERRDRERGDAELWNRVGIAMKRNRHN